MAVTKKNEVFIVGELVDVKTDVRTSSDGKTYISGKVSTKVVVDGVENISEKRLNDAGYDKSISYSVVVYWDSITCSSCVLDELYIWKEHYDELKSLNMDVLFIFNADDIKKITRDF